MLGPWTNPRWLNVVAGAVVASFLVLSGFLVISTLFPAAVIGWPAIGSSLAGAATLGALTGLPLGDGTGRPRHPWPGRSTWTMPRIESLPPPPASRMRSLAPRP